MIRRLIDFSIDNPLLIIMGWLLVVAIGGVIGGVVSERLNALESDFDFQPVAGMFEQAKLFRAQLEAAIAKIDRKTRTRFKETFEGIRHIEIIDEDDRGARVRYTIKAWILTFDYTLQRDYVRPYELITWRRTGGDFRLISGSWMAKDAFIKRATGRNRNAPALARGASLTELLHP